MIRRSPAEFKTAAQRGEFLLGTWLTSSDPMVAEVVASAGFDFAILDGEHGPVTASSALTTQIVADRAGLPLIVRIPSIDPVPIMAALDFGAAGILVPRVTSANDAERAAGLAHYPPSGSRGFGPRRVSNYLRDVDSYVAGAADSTTVIIQIETQGALDDLDAILGLPRVDGILVGRNDLAMELGLPRDPSNPALAALTTDVLVRARKAGKAAGIASSAIPAAARAARDLGATMVAAGIDVEFLARAVDGFITDARSTHA
ncbi:MAG: 4-hydroxy-2-oxo-heptane-1,7-dioate aldolase [Actinobacteria bacterium]|nr:4-hydroxy-2-oxo-heptane-1,7-dioate aldolase [Actinomycetota bacterium]